MSIKNNSVVRFHYTLSDKDGNAVDSSAGGEPLPYLHGANNIVPGLEKELEGKDVGDKMDVQVSAAEGYGEYNPNLKQTAPRELFEGVDAIEVGSQFEAQTDQGPISVVVTEVNDDEVVVDGNHPLAGQDLFFSVEIVEVRDATQEEIAHQHVH